MRNSYANHITLEMNQAKLIRCERELKILEDPNFNVCSNMHNLNRARRQHRYLLRHLKRNIKRLNVVIEKQRIQRAEDNVVKLKLAKIVKHFNGFIIMAQGYDDFETKRSKIQRGDTRGFYTIEYALNLKDKNEN